MTNYRITLTTLSPLHIGDGTELRQGFDFVVRQTTTTSGGTLTQTCRLDEDSLLDAKASQIRPDRTGAYPVPGTLLSADDIQEGRFFRYVLRGRPRTSNVDGRLRSMMKDVYGVPYIPGSSLKGALRTGLAWSGWHEVIQQVTRADIGNRREWAGQDLEHKLFGRDPNHDLLRALQVSDLHPTSDIHKRLAVINVQVMTRRGQAAPIEVEAVLADAAFSGTLKIDDTLFSPMAEPELHFASRRQWLDELIPRVQRHSQHRLQQLHDWFAAADQGEGIAGFYQQLLNANLTGSSQAVIQMGWGAGWDAKTFGSHLQADEHLFERLVTDYRMNRAGRNGAARQVGDPFPKSKRVMMLAEQQPNGTWVAKPARPMGWVLLQLEETDHA